MRKENLIRDSIRFYKIFIKWKIMETKQKTGFCTIFNKKNNKAVTTFNTVWEFTENHGKVYWIVNWLLEDTSGMPKEDKEEMIKDLTDFANNKLDRFDKEDIDVMTKMFKLFDEKYRILIGN